MLILYSFFYSDAHFLSFRYAILNHSMVSFFLFCKFTFTEKSLTLVLFCSVYSFIGNYTFKGIQNTMCLWPNRILCFEEKMFSISWKHFKKKR